MKIVQITAAQGFLFALTESGEIWCYNAMTTPDKQWVKLSNLAIFASHVR